MSMALVATTSVAVVVPSRSMVQRSSNVTAVTRGGQHLVRARDLDTAVVDA